jgi:hypothetical protein
MFSKVNQVAQKVADEISVGRRGFFSGIGKAGAAFAAGLAGFLALPGGASANNPPVNCWCYYKVNGTQQKTCTSLANCISLRGLCDGSC